MAELAQLESALVKADAAGDVDGARVLAAEVRKMRGTQIPQTVIPSGEKTLPWDQIMAGNPVTRFALGAASPFLGAAQLLGTGPNLANLERTKREGMALAGDETDVAGFAGTVFSPAFLAAAKTIPGATSYIGKILQGMGMGAGAGLTTPVTSGDDFATQKAIQTGTGAVGGGAIAAVAPAVTKLGKIGYSALVEPWSNPAAIKGRAFLDAAGDKADEILSLLRRNKQIVPGSAPTAGEAAAPAGSAEFAALQKSATTVKPSEYVARSDAQNAARLAAIKGVGQDEAALAAARTTRAENATEAYGAIRHLKVDPRSDVEIMRDAIMNKERGKGAALQQWGKFATGEAENLTRGENFFPVQGMPRVSARASNFPERVAEHQQAAKDAIELAKTYHGEEKFLTKTLDLLKQTVGMEDKNLQFFLNRPSIREAVKDATQSAQETGSYFPTRDGDKFSIGNLQRIKESLDAGIAAAKRATDAGRRPELSPQELGGTKNAFIKWLSAKSPAWKAARVQYQENSIPINQMEIGQYLEKKLVPALSDEAKQRAGTFATAVQDAAGTVKRATGSPRFEKLSEALNPEQLAVVKSVQEDLARGARFEELATKGSQAAPNAIVLASGSMETQAGGKIPNLLHRGAMIMNAIITRLEGKVNKKLAAEMAMEMLNPPKVAESLAQAQTREANNRIFAKTLERRVLATTGGGVQATEKSYQ